MCSACTYLNENCQNVLSICIQCKYLHEHEKNMFLCKCLGVSDPIYIYCMCIYVFVHSLKKVFFQPEQVKAIQFCCCCCQRASARVNRAMKGRKSAASRKECSLRNTAALSLLGPLLLYTSCPQLPTTARDLSLQVNSPVGPETYTQNLKTQLQSLWLMKT